MPEEKFVDLDLNSLLVDDSISVQKPEIVASYCPHRGLNKSQTTTTVVHGLL